MAFMGMGLLSLFFFTGCSQSRQPIQEDSGTRLLQEIRTEPGPATLLYQGQASIRIVTDEVKVIYIDPYSGDSYELPADLILVTHSHFDHNQMDKVEKRNEDCRIITYKEAVQNGEHQIFELDFVTIEAVEAGYNPLHDVND